MDHYCSGIYKNTRLKRIVADLELDKLILKENLQLPKAEGLTIADLRQAVIHVRQKLAAAPQISEPYLEHRFRP